MKKILFIILFILFFSVFDFYNLNYAVEEPVKYMLEVSTIDIDGETKNYTYFQHSEKENTESLDWFRHQLKTNIPGWICGATFSRSNSRLFELGCIPVSSFGKNAVFSRIFTRGECPSKEPVILIVNIAGPKDKNISGLSITASCK